MDAIAFFIAGAALGAALGALGWRRRTAQTVSPGPSTPASDRLGRSKLEASERIVDLLSEGVVVLNDVLRPALTNPAAVKLLALADDAPSLLPDELMSIARRAVTTRTRISEVVDLWNPKRVSLSVTATPLEDDQGALITLRDVSNEQRALRVRRQFVSHASHELKSPVAGIQALAEAISKAVQDDPEAAEQFSKKLLKETSRVGKLISDLLDLSRIEDPGSFSRAPVEVSGVAARVADETQPRAVAKGLTLRTQIEPKLWTQGDDQQLCLLVRNLVDNAIRYTPAGGHVSLEARRDEGQVLVRVTDDGIGIPLKSQARVFERFYRVDEARSRDQGGTGLGLAIVKHVADLYGGRVELRSEFGEGSTFTVYLPAVEQPADATAKT